MLFCSSPFTDTDTVTPGQAPQLRSRHMQHTTWREMLECEKTLSEEWMLPADTPLSLRPIAAKALSVVQSGQGYPVEPPPFQGDDGVWTVALGEEIRLPPFVIKLTRDPNRGLTKPAECIDIDPNWANSAAPLLVFETKE